MAGEWGAHSGSQFACFWQTLRCIDGVYGSVHHIRWLLRVHGSCTTHFRRRSAWSSVGAARASMLDDFLRRKRFLQLRLLRFYFAWVC